MRNPPAPSTAQLLLAYAAWIVAEAAVVYAVVFVLMMLAGAFGWLGLPPEPSAIPVLLLCFAALAWLLHRVDERCNVWCLKVSQLLVDRFGGR
jgi:hypothetical protein